MQLLYLKVHGTGTSNPNYKSTYNLLGGLEGLRGLRSTVIIGGL